MSLAKNAGKMSVAVFLSRILGLVREQVFAAFFGAGLVSDAYLVAFRIPNLLRDLFAEGALSQAFVTVLSRTDPGRDRQRAAREVMTALSFIVGLVCLLIALAAPWIVELLASSFHEEAGKFELTVQLTRLFSPFLYFASAAAMSMGILNTLGSFFIPALGSAAFNLGNILVGGGLSWVLYRSGYSSTAAIWGFAMGTLVGGGLQWLVQWPSLKGQGFRPLAGTKGMFSLKRLRESFQDSSVRSVGWLMAPSILSIASVQLNTFVGTWFATSLEEGSVSWISYAYRLLHFPMGVFGVALSTAALPTLASLARAQKMQAFEDTLEKAGTLSWILTLGSTLGLWIFSEPLIAMIFQHGRFSAQDTAQTALALKAYSIGLVSFVQSKIFVQAFYAMEKVWISSTISLASVLLSILLNVALIPRWGHAAIPLSTALTSWAVTCGLGLVLFRQGVHFVSLRSVRVALGMGLGSCVLGAFAVFECPAYLLSLRETRGQSVFMVATLATVAVAGGAYLAAVAALTTEGRELAQKLGARLRRK